MSADTDLPDHVSANDGTLDPEIVSRLRVTLNGVAAENVLEAERGSPGWVRCIVPPDPALVFVEQLFAINERHHRPFNAYVDVAEVGNNARGWPEIVLRGEVAFALTEGIT